MGRKLARGVYPTATSCCYCLFLSFSRTHLRYDDDRDRPFLITVAPIVRVCWHALVCARPSVRPFVRLYVRSSVGLSARLYARVPVCVRATNFASGIKLKKKNIRDRVV